MIKSLRSMRATPVLHRDTPPKISALILCLRPYLNADASNSEAFICLAERNVIKNAKYFVAEQNIACFTIGYGQGIMHCDVTGITTVSLFLDSS